MFKYFIILFILICVCLWKGCQGKKEMSGGGVSADQQLIVDTLQDIHELFEKHGIWYSISYGTLLGAVRHHGIIPWDDDADLFVLKADREKIWALKDEFAKRGRRLESTWKLDRIFCGSKELPFIDLFNIKFNEKGLMKRCRLDLKDSNDDCSYLNSKWWQPNDYYAHEYKERKLYKFNGILLYGPLVPKPILEKSYGKSCLTQCKTHNWDHVNSKPIQAKDISCGQLPKPQLR